MPYTPKERRPSVNQEYGNLCIEKAGDLAAVIYDLMLRFIDQDDDPSFDRIADSIKAANAAIDELTKIKDYYEGFARVKNGGFELESKINRKIERKFGHDFDKQV